MKLSRSRNSKALLPLLFLPALLACVFNSSDNSVSMKLQTEVPGYELIEVGTDPFTYRLNNTETGEFITAVRNCSFSEKTSVESTTRQLLVGLERLHISRQDSVEINGERFLRSHIDAQLEGRPVKMATYSYRLGRCVSDLVIWSETRSQHQQETDRIASHFSLLLTE